MQTLLHSKYSDCSSVPIPFPTLFHLPDRSDGSCSKLQVSQHWSTFENRLYPHKPPAFFQEYWQTGFRRETACWLPSRSGTRCGFQGHQSRKDAGRLRDCTLLPSFRNHDSLVDLSSGHQLWRNRLRPTGRFELRTHAERTRLASRIRYPRRKLVTQALVGRRNPPVWSGHEGTWLGKQD